MILLSERRLVSIVLAIEARLERLRSGADEEVSLKRLVDLEAVDVARWRLKGVVAHRRGIFDSERGDFGRGGLVVETERSAATVEAKKSSLGTSK